MPFYPILVDPFQGCAPTPVRGKDLEIHGGCRKGTGMREFAAERNDRTGEAQHLDLVTILDVAELACFFCSWPIPE